MYKICILLAVVGVTLAAPNKSFISLGHPNANLSNNVGIVGGHDTDITNHPWQISLQYQYKHFCGGVLISSYWAITASHCITQGYNTDLNIRAGSTQRDSGGQTASVVDYIIHPNWSDETYDNDICLLKLGTAITNFYAKVATLPPAGATVPIDVSLYLSGWGATSENGKGSQVLQEVTVPTIDNNKCSIENAEIGPVTRNMFCAGFDQGGRDACQGDSGGPASINGVVVGIASWGNGCARANYPGVYVKISNYRGWIAQYTGV